MFDWNVVCKFMLEELVIYRGLIYYIFYYEVLKLDFKIMLVWIVFNSSVNFMGYVFNEYWVKGLDLLNSFIGILIRFRENEIVFIGDVCKMYYIVYIKEFD